VLTGVASPVTGAPGAALLYALAAVLLWPARLAPAARPLLCPRLAACCQIMMGVAMAYMLILML
jgi:hypothetical protein